MKTALICTLGFDEKFAIRSILRNGLSEGDRLVLITVELIEKVGKAYTTIEKLINTSFEETKVEILELDIDEFTESVKKVRDVLEECSKYDRIIVNLSGGMRALILIVFYACIIEAKPNLEVEIETEDFESVIRIPSNLIRLPSIMLTGDKLEVLHAIIEGIGNVKELAKKLNKDESTIRRHLSALEELGLIEVTKRKPMQFTATETAELILARREK